jgi:hypothetical protein
MALAAQAHDPITTKLTWSREISRLIYDRCASCHRPGGAAFSLLTYQDARPWAKAIAEEVLERRMPPWGAVKGFGDFRNDPSLTQEQLNLIANWVEGGAPEGEAKDVPSLPKAAPLGSPAAGRALEIDGPYTVERTVTLRGILPKSVPRTASVRITAEFPDGHVEPLVWLYNYVPRFGHAFLFRKPLLLPKGTIIHGVPRESPIALLIATATR